MRSDSQILRQRCRRPLSTPPTQLPSLEREPLDHLTAVALYRHSPPPSLCPSETKLQRQDMRRNCSCCLPRLRLARGTHGCHSRSRDPQIQVPARCYSRQRVPQLIGLRRFHQGTLRDAALQPRDDVHVLDSDGLGVRNWSRTGAVSVEVERDVRTGDRALERLLVDGFRDSSMIRQIEEKVVNRLRQVTSAIKQDGANQVSVIASTAERQAAVEFARAAAMRPRIVGAALQEIAREEDITRAMFEILETQHIIEGEADITMVPPNSDVLNQLLAARTGTDGST